MRNKEERGVRGQEKGGVDEEALIYGATQAPLWIENHLMELNFYTGRCLLI